MVPIMSLWLPILISAVLVFVISAIVHMVLPYHRSDFKQLPAEGEVMDAVRKSGAKPGDYMAPYCRTPGEMKSPEFMERRMKGPVLIMTVIPGGPVAMGKELLQWFLFCVFVSFFAAYIAGHALPPGAEYLEVFRFAGAAAFAAHALAHIPQSIWYKRSWCTSMKDVFDGLLYALFTAGIFGWLWPGR
jgi:hypothetical protein